MSDLTTILGPVLTALRALPLWLLAGIAVAAWILLFAPALAGVEVDPFRREWGVYVWLFAIVFTVFSATRAVDMLVTLHSKRAASKLAARVLRLIPLDHQRWWHLAKQKDDSFSSQISLQIQITNTSTQTVQIVKTRLVKPKAKLIRADTMLPLHGSPYHSDRHPVPANGTVPASVHIMVRRALARAGKPLRIAIGITDQFGEEYILRDLIIPTNDRAIPHQPLLQMLSAIRKHVQRLRSEDPPQPVMSWTFESGAEYINVCESILEEEKRQYAANGRERGGLGSLNTGLQSEPNKGWTTEGQVPQLLWPPAEAVALSSPNLDRLLACHARIASSDRDNLERYLLSNLRRDSRFSEISYFIFLALLRVGRAVDAITTARTFLAGDKVHGYSNLLGTLSAVISREHFSLSPDLYPAMIDALAGDNEFRLREKINLARLEHFDRSMTR